MKKVLLASTALVVTSSAAMAEVGLSGYAEMGIVGGGGAMETQFHHDIDVKFSLSGETDNGLSFGATIDLDEVGDDCTKTTAATASDPCIGGDPISSGSGEHSVFISGSFGTLTMGDTDGAFDWALTEVGSLTALADEHTSHSGYSGNSGLDGTSDGQILRYDNTFGDLGFALSAELDDTGTSAAGDTIGVGVKWASGDFGVGVGFQQNDVTDIMGVSLSASMGDLTGVLNFSTSDTAGVDTDHMAVGVTYTSGPLSLHANYGEFDTAGVSSDGFGLAANYDLGGGAVAMLGYTDTYAGNAGDSAWSLGLGMSF